MKKWTFKTKEGETLWETSVREYADEFQKLLEMKGKEYVITISEA